MNILQAEKILSKVREGADYSEATITRALFMVGEIDGHEFGGVAGMDRGPGVDKTIPEKTDGIGAFRGQSVVG